MFKVIEFGGDCDTNGGGISVVRHEWLTPLKKECLWPPHKVLAKFNKCLLHGASPDETWAIYNVKRIFYESDDLLKAREKCKEAENESEICTEEEGEKIKKRKRKRPVVSSSEGESDIESNKTIDYPVPPRKVCDSQSIGQGKSRSNSPDIPQNHNIGSPLSMQRVGNTEESFTQILNYGSRTPTTRTPQLKALKPSTDKINAVLDVVATHLGEILNEIREIKQTQNDLISSLSSHSTSAVQAVLPEHIKLPINELQELENLELWLDDKDNAESLINYLSCIGGNKTTAVTRRILERVFANSFAVKCNWTGKNNKISLKDKRLLKVILGAVRKNHISQAETDATLTDIVTRWFRFAKDRDGGRENRRSTPNI